jgi:hypothetical protein
MIPSALLIEIKRLPFMLPGGSIDPEVVLKLLFGEKLLKMIITQQPLG